MCFIKKTPWVWTYHITQILITMSYLSSKMLVLPVMDVFCVEARCQCYKQLPGHIQGICEIKYKFTCK